MNPTAGIAPADGPVPGAAPAKSASSTADDWQRASAQAMHRNATPPEAQARGSASKDTKRTAASSATESRSRKRKPAAAKATPDPRQATPALSLNAAIAAPLAQPARVADGAESPAQKSTPDPGRVTVKTISASRVAASVAGAGAQAARAPATADATGVQTTSPQASLRPAARQPASSKPAAAADLRLAAGTQPAASQDSAASAAASPAHPAVAAAPAMAVVSAGESLRNARETAASESINATKVQTPESALRTTSLRLQKSSSADASIPAASANYYAAVNGIVGGSPAGNSAAAVLTHVPGGHAAAGAQNLVEQLNAPLQALYQTGGGQTVVQLNPPALGSVQVHVQLQANHGLTVNFVASQPQAVQVIQTGIPMLAQALQQNHLQLAQAQVTLGNAAGGGPSFGQQGSAPFQQPGGGTHAWSASALAPEGREPAQDTGPATPGVMAYA